MLTNDEIQMLLDALGQKILSDSALGSLPGVMLPPEHRIEAEKQLEIAKQRALLKLDEIILLKAKLIKMKDKSLVEDASDFLKRGSV